MRRLLLSSIVAPIALLASCSADAPVPAERPASDAAPVVAEPQQPCSHTDSGYSPLPEGVVMEQAFHVRSDRYYVTSKGVERRRVALELLEGDSRTVARALADRLEANGFRPLKSEKPDDGVLRLALQKKGPGRINISATDKVGDKPSHPRAVGVVAIDWQPAPASETAPPAAQAP